MFKTTRRSTIVRSLAALGAVVALGAGSATPASAVSVGPLSHPNVSGFGNNWVWDAPQQPAILDWNLVGNITTPNVRGGRLYIDGLHNARLEMEIWDSPAHNTKIATEYSNLQSGVAGALTSWPVGFGSTASTGTHVHLKLRDNWGGNMQTWDTAYCTLGVGC